MDNQVLEMIAIRLKALGDVSRLRIVEILRNGERSVGDLAEDLNMLHGTVSAQLRVLENAGLVSKRKE
ncbi:MAG: metalloregulator ArsR/SmtB family transcription factor, partial [bacterium]